MDFTAAILAGGASRRMGTPKALLPFWSDNQEHDASPQAHGVPLVAHIAHILRPLFGSVVVVTSSPAIADAAGLPQVEDVFAGKGPLAGIHAALGYFNDFSSEPVFCVACDMPHLNVDFIAYLLEQWADCDAVVPRRGVYDEPLHAIYGQSCLPAIERELGREHVGPIDNIFHDLRVTWVDENEARRFDAELRLFDNWNTPDDVKKSRGQ